MSLCLSASRVVWLAGSFAVVVALAAPKSAYAAPPKPSSAQAEGGAAALKKQGDQAMLELRYEDALDAYARSYALEANPALHYNRGRALEALGRYPDALEAYEAFVAQASPELKSKAPGLAEHVRDVRLRVTTLTVKVNLPEARVLLRNVAIGASPLPGPVRVNSGKATLEVSLDGYLPYKKELELPGGDALVVDVTLVTRATGGTLVVATTPTATVVLDGVAAGVTPLEAPVVAGSHTLALSAKGYVARTTTVVVAEGERKRLDLSLEKETSVFGRWWFWTTVGVVVIGAAATTYALTTDRAAGVGDIAPGRVAAPLIRW